MEPHALMLAAAVITVPPPGPDSPPGCAGEVVAAHPVMLNVTASTATDIMPTRRPLTALPHESCDVRDRTVAFYGQIGPAFALFGEHLGTHRGVRHERI
jgi:hypothetical protein